MLKFLVQTFYQPLFNHSPLAIFFPSAIFSLPKASHTKKPQGKSKSKKLKAKARAKSQKQNAKAQGKRQKPLFLLQGVFYKQW
jgi:hypothetical protein